MKRRRATAIPLITNLVYTLPLLKKERVKMALTEKQKAQIAAFIPFAHQTGGEWDICSKSVLEQVEKMLIDEYNKGYKDATDVMRYKVTQALNEKL